MHTIIACRPDPSTECGWKKSYSYVYTCPLCGLSRRQNANFLGGNNRIACNGEKTFKEGIPTLRTGSISEMAAIVRQVAEEDRILLELNQP